MPMGGPEAHEVLLRSSAFPLERPAASPRKGCPFFRTQAGSPITISVLAFNVEVPSADLKRTWAGLSRFLSVDSAGWARQAATRPNCTNTMGWGSMITGEISRRSGKIRQYQRRANLVPFQLYPPNITMTRRHLDRRSQNLVICPNRLERH